MVDDASPELAANLAYYRSSEAVAAYSFYRLLDEEQDLFPKYFKAGDSVLDLGCGMGRTTLLLHEMGMRVRGLDRSEVCIEVAKRRFPYLDLHVGNYEAVDEADASFAHVLIALNSIDYAFPESQRARVFAECVRVLKPGGSLICSSHNLKSLHWFSPYYGHRLRWKLRNCLRAYGTSCYIREGEEHVFYGAPTRTVEQAESAGLRLREMRGFGRFRSRRIDHYFSPYLHYVFAKPAR